MRIFCTLILLLMALEVGLLAAAFADPIVPDPPPFIAPTTVLIHGPGVTTTLCTTTASGFEYCR